jgi:catechol 2,3-dioxygenase-like lactoylglutathione lyase family enzyme
MKLRINHVAIMADDAKDLSKFYREVLGLEPTHTPSATEINLDTYKWLRAGDSEIHIVGRDDTVAKRLGLEIDPMKSHFAFECESPEQIREITDRLTKAGVKWIDWSPYGIPGKHQVFMIDPGGNLVEFQLGPNSA